MRRPRVTASSAASLLAGTLRLCAAGQLFRPMLGLPDRRCAAGPGRRRCSSTSCSPTSSSARSGAIGPDFASLFLNAGAHIQHHYMFNSQAYSGERRNPDWYIAPGEDPVLEVYELYDRIVGQVQRAFPDARLMLATGLHQDPHARGHLLLAPARPCRLPARDRRAVPAASSRACRAISSSPAPMRRRRGRRRSRLALVRSQDGVPLFEVDNRGSDLFVMLAWPHDIPDDFRISRRQRGSSGLRERCRLRRHQEWRAITGSAI